MALWDEVRENIVDWYTKAAEATEDLARMGVHKYDRFGVSRDIERQFTELGSQVYKLLVEERGEGVESDPTVLQILRRIEALEAELRAKDAEYESLRRRREASAGSGGSDEAESGDSTSRPPGTDDPEPGQPDTGGSDQESTTPSSKGGSATESAR